MMSDNIPAHPESIPGQVRKLLESYFWLPTLQPNTAYTRRHDDHDGTFQGTLSVIIGEDGDAWVNPVNAEGDGLRFRMPLHGGGESQYTRTALVILAEAIRLDNETRPQRRPPPEVREHGERGPICNFTPSCGKPMTWCAICRVWSNTCCVEYGTCQCS